MFFGRFFQSSKSIDKQISYPQFVFWNIKTHSHCACFQFNKQSDVESYMKYTVNNEGIIWNGKKEQNEMRNFVYGGKNVNCFSLFSICFSNFVSSLFIFFYLKTVLYYCRRVQTVNSIKLIASKRVNCLISNYIYSSPDWVARTVTMLNSTFSMRYSMSSLTLPKIDFLDDFVNSAFVRQEVDWCEKCSSAFKHLNRINDFDSASFRGL